MLTPTVGVTGNTGVRITPAHAANTHPKPNESMFTHSVLTPNMEAISRSMATLRITRPNHVLCMTTMKRVITAAAAAKEASR